MFEERLSLDDVTTDAMTLCFPRTGPFVFRHLFVRPLLSTTTAMTMIKTTMTSSIIKYTRTHFIRSTQHYRFIYDKPPSLSHPLIEKLFKIIYITHTRTSKRTCRFKKTRFFYRLPSPYDGSLKIIKSQTIFTTTTRFVGITRCRHLIAKRGTVYRTPSALNPLRVYRNYM